MDKTVVSHILVPSKSYLNKDYNLLTHPYLKIKKKNEHLENTSHCICEYCFKFFGIFKIFPSYFKYPSHSLMEQSSLLVRLLAAQLMRTLTKHKGLIL